MNRNIAVRNVVAVAATLGLAFAPALPAIADDAPDATLQELREIGTTRDSAALAALNPDELARFIALSRLDPSKSTSETTINFTVDGEPATTAQAAELRAALDQSSDTSDPTSVAGKLNGPLSAAAVCYYASRTNYGRGPGGDTLYTYYIQIKWCMAGSSVTSTSTIARGGSTQWLGWDYLGVTASGSSVIGNWGRNYAQYKFQYSVFHVGVIQTVFPCSQLHGIGVNLVRVGSACGLL